MTAPVQQLPDQRLSPTQLAAILALVQAQAAIRQQLTAAAVSGAMAILRGFTDWWSPPAVEALVGRVLRVVRPAQLQAARTTDAYFSNVSSLILGRPVRPVGAVDVGKLRRDIPPSVAKALVDGRIRPAWIELGNTVDGPGKSINDPFTPRIHPPLVQPRPGVSVQPARAELPARGVAPAPEEPVPVLTARERNAMWLPPAVPYRRIAEQYRYQVIAEGVPEEKAQNKALVRIEALVRTDITLAVREQYYRNLNLPRGQRQQAVGWRRVLHPELSESGPCGLCVVAADRVYKREQLKEIHDRCVCEVLPIYVGADPGLTLNRDDLNRLYDAAGGTGGDVIKNGRRHSGALKKIRVVLTEHGELGPVLINADQHYRGPAEVAKTKVPDRAVRVKAQLESLEKKFESLQYRQLQGEELDRPIRWQADKISELRRELASIS